MTARTTADSPWRQRVRFAWQGMLTVSGLAKRGFFIPCSTAGRVRTGTCHYEAVEQLLRRKEPHFAAFLSEMESVRTALFALGQEPPPAPRWEQDWFPRLDAAAAYTMVLRMAPKRIVEIGCGHSTRFVAQAVLDGDLPTEIVAIDPAPRADLAGLPLTRRGGVVQDLPLNTFAELAAGDFLMIDSSHILMPGSDVDYFFGCVLPGLPAGVIVHVHDIFLPDDYPAAWTWRGYNEQQILAPLITCGGWEVLHASHYLATRMRARLAAGPLARLPLPAGARESSLWLRKLSPAVPVSPSVTDLH